MEDASSQTGKPHQLYATDADAMTAQCSPTHAVRGVHPLLPLCCPAGSTPHPCHLSAHAGQRTVKAWTNHLGAAKLGLPTLEHGKLRHTD